MSTHNICFPGEGENINIHLNTQSYLKLCWFFNSHLSLECLAGSCMDSSRLDDYPHIPLLVHGPNPTSLGHIMNTSHGECKE